MADARGFAEHLKTAEDLSFAQSVLAAGHRGVLVTSAEVGPTLRSTAVMYFRYGQGDGQLANVRFLGRDITRAGAYLGACRCLWRVTYLALLACRRAKC